MILQQIRVPRPVHGDLVGKAPHHNAGMVVILDHQFLHLGNRIVPALFQMLRDIGNLRPDHHALLVTEIVKILVMLVVSQPDGIGPHLADQVHILLVIPFRQGIPLFRPVLMPGHAPQGIALSVQDKTFLRVDGKTAAAKARFSLIQFRLSVPEHRLEGIQMRIPASVPKAHVFDSHIHSGVCRGGLRLRHLFLAVPYGKMQFLRSLGAADIGIDPDPGVFSLYRGRHRHAGAPEIIQVKSGLSHIQQRHIPVYTAIKSEIRHLGIHMIIGRVVHQHPDFIFLLQGPGEIASPGGIAAIMMSQQFSVHIQIRRGIDAFKLQIDLLPLRLLLFQYFSVTAGSPVVVVTAVLAVRAVPGMRQVHRFPIPLPGGVPLPALRIHPGSLAELPSLVPTDFFHRHPLLRIAARSQPGSFAA